MTDDERRIEELRVALAARDEILGVVAHDLRGPLNIVTMGLEILRQSAPTGQESNIERMRRAIEMMSGLVTNLIDLSNLREGRTVLNAATIYPEVLMRAVHLTQQPLLSRRGLVLEQSVPSGLPPLSADYERLLRVFAELVGHAARKARPGTAIRIEVDAGDGSEAGAVVNAAAGSGGNPVAGPGENGAAGANRRTGAVCFRVIHDGTPVRHDELGVDVNAYFRLATSERKVADLGLAIARAIIEAHGGRVVPPTDPAGEPVIRFWLPSPGAG